MRRRAVVVSALASACAMPLAIAAAAAGCSILTSYDGFAGGSSDATAASDTSIIATSDAGDGSSAADAALCPVEIPSAPAIPDDGISSLPVYGVTSAMSVLEDGTIACTLGFDIDHGHICSDDASTPACGGTTGFCNQGGGHDDNSKHALGFAVANFNDNFSGVIPLALGAHQIGLLVSVGDYNGAANDSHVNVTLYNVVGQDSNGLITDSNDELGGVLHTDPNAYVSGGLLVASFGAAFVPVRLALGLPGDAGVEAFFVVNVSSAMLVGAISKDPSGLTLQNAQLTGRVRAQDFAHELGEIDGCGDDTLICPFLDVPTSGSNDGDNSKNCDAISFSLGFQMGPSQKSGHAPGIQPVDFCVKDAGESTVGDDSGDAQPAPVMDDPDANPCL